MLDLCNTSDSCVKEMKLCGDLHDLNEKAVL